MISESSPRRPVELLVIEDNPGDVRLLEVAFKEAFVDVRLHVAHDGVEGLTWVYDSVRSERNRQLDLILLDLNLPKLNGHAVLQKLKTDPATRRIPVIILTSSQAQADIARAYDFHANAYMSKPRTLDGLLTAVRDIASFWMRTATLPS